MTVFGAPARSQNVSKGEKSVSVPLRIWSEAKHPDERERRLWVLAGEGIRGAQRPRPGVPDIEIIDLPSPRRSDVVELLELASQVVDQLGWQGPRKACHVLDAGAYLRQKPAEARIDMRWLG